MKVRIQCIGCKEQFKFVVEPGMNYDFVCPQCNQEQSFETPPAGGGRTEEICGEGPAPAAESGEPPKKVSIGLKSPEPGMPSPADGGPAPPPGFGDKYAPPPKSKKDIRLKKDGRDKLGAVMKWSFRLILFAIVAWIGWAVWKNFLDPGGKIAWEKKLLLKSFHLLSNENGKLRFLNDGKVMSLDAENGEITVTAELPDYSRYPLLLAECGNNRAVFAGGEQERFSGMSPGKELAMMDFGGRKVWERGFTGRIESAVCGDEIMIVQTVEPVYKETRNDVQIYDYIYRVKALRMSDGSEVWTRGPQTNENIFYNSIAGGKMMLSQSYEADAVEPKDGKEDKEDGIWEARRGTTVLTVSELATGKVAWRLKTRDALEWGPFIRGNSLIFRQKNKLTALKLDDGAKLWELTVAGEPNPRFIRALESDVVYFTSKKEIAAVDLKSGRELWKNQYEIEPDISVVSDKFIFLRSMTEKAVEEKEGENKLPPAYEKLKQEEPDLFGNTMNGKGPAVKYERNFVCLDAATGKRLWEMRKIYGQVVADGDRIVLFWDSADTTALGGLNRSGKTVIRQYAAKNGKKLFERNDAVALSPPCLICGGKLVALTHDRVAGPSSDPNGFAAFNLK